MLDMKQGSNFLKDAYNELVVKTTWPEWDDLQSNTVVVAGSSVLIAAVIFVADKIFELGVDSYFSIFVK